LGFGGFVPLYFPDFVLGLYYPSFLPGALNLGPKDFFYPQGGLTFFSSLFPRGGSHYLWVTFGAHVSPIYTLPVVKSPLFGAFSF